LAEVKVYKDRNLRVVFGVTLMSILAITSLSPAFPRIVEELNISKTDVGMLITAYTLPGIVLSLLLGVFADRFGRKRILVPSLFLFGLAGGACALTRDFNILLVLRVLQGIGGAGVSVLNWVILGDLFSGRQRAEAMGLNSTVLNIGSASYPTIGGALAVFAWNYPFLLPLVAIPVGVLVLCFLHNPEPRSRQGLREYLAGTWSSLKRIRVAGAFTAAIAVFILRHGAYHTYFSLFLGISLHLSPFIIGIIFSVSSLVTALVSSQLGRMVKVVSEAGLVKLGFVIYALGLGLLPFMARLELVLVPAIIYGIGHGVAIPSLQSYVAGLAPFEYRAAFMSLNTTVHRVGQTLGPLILGLAYIYAGFEGVFLSAAGLALAVAIVGAIGGKMIR